MRIGQDFTALLLGGELVYSTIHLRTGETGGREGGKAGAGRGEPRLHD